MPNRPTILVGIGSGGLRSIEAAWKLSQEIPNPADRPLVEYLYLETDSANKPVSEEIISSSLTVNDIGASTQAIKNDISATSQWLNDMNFPSNILSGAGGSPVVGRLSLWDMNNRNVFVQNLHSAQGRLANKSTEKPLVYVVGSFGGGTGSGTFLDIAYVIRDAFAGNVELHGLFMIPNMGLNTQVVYSNTICCLKELDYYSGDEHEFPFKWSANPPKGYEAQNSPYELVQIISASYGVSSFGAQAGATLPPVTYSQLHEEAGIFLYLNALGLYDTRKGSLEDATGNVIITKYTTYGLAAIHYPEIDIKEIEANALALGFFQRTNDPVRYYDKDYLRYLDLSTSETAIRNKIRATFDKSFVNILEEWCGQIQIAENSQSVPVESHLHSLAHYLATSKDTYKEKRNHLYRLFKAGGEYYKQLKTLCSVNATDRVINLIKSETSDALNVYHNLNVAEIALDEIEQSIKNIQAFWQANGYTTLPVDWDSRLKSDLEKEVMPMPTMYTLLLEKEKVYYDRLKYVLLYGLAMHLFSDQVENIYKGLQGAQNAQGSRIVIRTTSGEVMPTTHLINEWKEYVDHVSEGASPNYSSCAQVHAMLMKKLSPANTGNIWYIYPNQDLPTTLQQVDGLFKSKYGDVRQVQDVTGNDDLYAFLSGITPNKVKNQYDAEKDLYRKVVSAYFDKVSLGQPFSVSNAIASGQFNHIIQMAAARSLIPHVPINPTGRNATFVLHDNIPHILIGYDGQGGTVLSGIANSLGNIGIHDYDIVNAGRNKFSHIGLNNWLVFYQEFGRMSDQKPFSIIDDLNDFNSYVQCYMADSAGSNLSAEKYHGMRMPYISYSDCHEVSTQYINKAMELEQNEELEEALKAYCYATYWDMHSQVPVDQQAALKLKLQNESTADRFDRYFRIADKFMGEQDYPNARSYYLKAAGIDKDEANVKAKIAQLNAIDMNVTSKLKEGDDLCESANALYEQCVIHHDATKRPDCLNAYNRIKELYEEALAMSECDQRIKRKILNIERRIQTL